MHSFQHLPKRRFHSATQARFLTNYFEIMLEPSIATIYQYSFQVDPPIESNSNQKLRAIVMSGAQELRKRIGLMYVRGNNLFGNKSKDLLDIETIYEETDKQLKQRYTIYIKLTNKIKIHEQLYSTNEKNRSFAIQLLNISTKDKLRDLGMVELGKGKFYKEHSLIQSGNNRNRPGYLYCRGYKFTVCPLSSGLHVQIDLFSRILKRENVLEMINNNSWSMDEATEKLRGAIVLARYGNFKTYEVLEVDFKKNPLTRFIPHNQQDQTTYKNYVQQNYKSVKVHIMKQPLVKAINMVEKLKKKGGKMQQKITYIYLIPQLLCYAGITREDRKDVYMMKEISNHTKFSPNERLSLIEKTTNQVREGGQLFKIGKRVEMMGYQLDPPTIEVRDAETVPLNQGAMNFGKETLVKEGMNLIQWYVTYNDDYWVYVKEFASHMVKLANNYGMAVDKPFYINLGKEASSEETIDCIYETIEKKQKVPQLIVVVLGMNQDEHYYSALKNMCNNFGNKQNMQLQKKPIITQFVQATKIVRFFKKHGARETSPIPFVMNILFQINAKLGYTLWEVPVKDPVIRNMKIACGSIAISKISKQYTLAFVGTINVKLSRVFNQTRKAKRIVDLQQQLAKIFLNWIKEFYFENKVEGRSGLPDILIFYREGLSKSQISSSTRVEINAIGDMIKSLRTIFINRKFASKETMEHYHPQIAYFIVNKNSHARYYERINNQIINPAPGSVIVDNMTMQGFEDFHLTPHKVNQNTTSCPTQFILAYKKLSKVKLESLIQFSYEQCYNYYNWKGAIRFPASLQNADKLAKLAAKHFDHQIMLRDKLRYGYHFL